MTVFQRERASEIRHPLLTALSEVLDETIAPAAAETDRTAVPSSHITALATRTDLLRLSVAPRWGGVEVPTEVAHRAWALLVAACPSTHLIVSQHAAPARWLEQLGNETAEELLPQLAEGRRIGAAAFGHVRNWPHRRDVEATRTRGGWLLNGVAPWFSGAGVATLLAVGAVDPSERRVLFAVVDIPAPGSLTEIPISLSAVAGSRTVEIRFDDFFVPDSRVTETADFDEWSASDGTNLPPIDPGVLGLAEAGITYALDRHPEDPHLGQLAQEIEFLWSVAQATATPNTDSSFYDGKSRLYWRTTATTVAVRATQAALVAAGGGGLRSDHITQIWARAASFQQVRGINSALRAEHFARWAGR